MNLLSKASSINEDDFLHNFLFAINVNNSLDNADNYFLNLSNIMKENDFAHFLFSNRTVNTFYSNEDDIQNKA